MEYCRYRFSLRVSRRKAGISLIELLTVIVIVCVLASLLFALAKNFIQASQGGKCAGNLKQLGVATALYTAEHNGYMPFYYTKSPEGNSFTSEGAWYWLLAPYLDVPRWDSNKTYLGVQGKKISAANVFSCPAHGRNEPAAPLVFPTSKPVSYAPSTEISGSMLPLTRQDNPNVSVNGLLVTNIPNPSAKAWVSDSTIGEGLNTATSRWTYEDDATAWARVPFQRHNGAGNVLFFDGHVEAVTYRSIVTGDIRTNVLRLFRPIDR